jgi:hypothetical protein
MMITLEHPGPDVPGTPRIRIEVPDGWIRVELPHTVLAARETDPPSGAFATNVTVQQLRRPAPVTEPMLIDELRGVVVKHEGGVFGDPFQRMINGSLLSGVNLSYLEPHAGTIGQVHLFTRHADGARAEIIQLVISFAGGRTVELLPVVRGIIESLKIDWADREPQDQVTPNS